MFMLASVAARLTKDYMDAPKPLGCSEPPECDELREGIRRKVMGQGKEEGHRNEL